MLFQAWVPSTYAAGQASLAVWRKRRASPTIKPEPVMTTGPRCECGQPRVKAKGACAGCLALDSEADTAQLDAIVINALQVGEEVSVVALLERCAFKLDRHVIRRALVRLIGASRVSRRMPGARRDGFLYTRLA